MSRLLLAALAAALLVALPASAGTDGVRLRGTVVVKNAAAHTTTIRSAHAMRHVLGVPGSLVRIHARQAVELRGSTLRLQRHGSRVLATGVTVVKASQAPSAREDDDEDDDEQDEDEVELEGPLTSIAPPTVNGTACALPQGFTLAGFAVGDVVELTCDRVGGVLTLRSIEAEDDGGQHGSGGGDDEHDD